MYNNQNNSAKETVLEGIRELDIVFETIKETTKELKRCQKKKVEFSINDENKIKSSLYGITAIYSKNCSDIEMFAKFMSLSEEKSDVYIAWALNEVKHQKERYVAFKNIQPNYIKKLMA